MNITENDVERCLDYLRDSAQEYASWRASEKFYESKLRQIEAAEFVEQQKGSVEYKRMQARASDAYNECLENYREAKYNAELLAAYRDAALHRISAWQTWKKSSQGAF